MDDLEIFGRMDYGRTARRIRMTEKVGEHWLKVFGNDTEFLVALWDPFTKLWQAQSVCP